MNAGQPEINRQAHPQQAPDNTYRQAEIHPRSHIQHGYQGKHQNPIHHQLDYGLVKKPY